jgi:hypothetical protein
MISPYPPQLFKTNPVDSLKESMKILRGRPGVLLDIKFYRKIAKALMN